VSETPTAAKPRRPGTLRSLWLAMRSWRTASVSLLSFSSGLPLGLVWIAIPDWLSTAGVEIEKIGLITLSQAPWTFKFLWSPLMDRFKPPFLGRRRGWAFLAQIGLFAGTLALAGVGDHPEAPWVVGALALAVAFASATQDIAIDAYAVDVLRADEQGIAVGARIAIYRAAMFIAGGLAISLASRIGWPMVNVGLGLLYLPMMLITWFAPEAEHQTAAPTSMKEAVWYPFLGFLSRHRALEILAFVVLYKLADNLGGSLLRPFLVEMGYSADDRGAGLATIGLVATLVGTLLGGICTTAWGLGHSLWIFGALQVFSNVGYILVAGSDVNRSLMFGAMGFESFTQGLGTGAFSVLLLRMTQKRFSATQYALFSSLFGIPRLLAGPIAGYMVGATGWTTFFWFTIVAGIPGLLLLARFVPLGVREPEFTVAEIADRRPLSRGELAARGAAGGLVGLGLGALVVACLDALKALKADEAATFDLVAPLGRLFAPSGVGGWSTVLGLLAFAVIVGLMTAAVVAARHGAGDRLRQEEQELAAREQG
jgi:PAT family beta-lactamase induction signal transducer AmpG